MIERVIENWLTSVNERSLEVPFCQLLAGEGYQVVHLSRHGPQEEGKDVLAIHPDGTPCAFQLKGAPGGRITQRVWEENREQAVRLVEIPIIHPSIDQDRPRRAYFVTNGDLDETVREEIAHRNLDWERRRHPPLETVVKGQLLARFKAIHTDFWPVQLSHERTLLELYLADGTGCLDKGKLAGLLFAALPIDAAQINKAESRRALASAAVLTTYCLAPYQQAANHMALIEGWVVYIATLTAMVEKFGLEKGCWRESLDIASSAIEASLEDLIAELRQRQTLVEGNPLYDSPFYRGRVTWLCALVAAYSLWKRLKVANIPIDTWCKEFMAAQRKDLVLWGEAAVPQFLLIYWFQRQISGGCEPDGLLQTLIDVICMHNNDRKRGGLPDPYHDLGNVVATQAGLTDDADHENHAGESYMLEILVHLFARLGWRRRLQLLWPGITHVHYVRFQPASRWQFCLWHTEEGVTHTAAPKFTQSWQELRAEAAQIDVSEVPALLVESPELLLMFVLVYPHRLSTNIAKYLDEKLRQVRLQAA